MIYQMDFLLKEFQYSECQLHNFIFWEIKISRIKYHFQPEVKFIHIAVFFSTKSKTWTS